MRPSRTARLLTAAISFAVLGGCSTGPKPLTYLGHSDLKYYKDLATKVDYPACAAEDSRDAVASQEPPRLRSQRKDAVWDLSLNEAIHIALKNNKIIRSREQVQFPRNPLVVNPEQQPSVYDPAIQETGVLFGQRGVEAALSDFDAQFSLNFNTATNEAIQNNAQVSGLPPNVNILSEDTATFRARLDKTFADSTQFSLINEFDYLQNNLVGNRFPSVYTGFARAEIRRPLLAGAGADYTRIAGPINRNTPGVAQGVVIARINNDITIAEFEASVHSLIRDVQTSYWDLGLAYRTYDAQVTSFKSALQTWRLIHAKATQGLEGGSSADEAQSLDNLYESRGRQQDSLSNIYTTEGQFRRLLGLSVNDGRIIRPCDEPAIAEFIPDWHIAVAEAITRRPEIRRQKWNIKSLELQLESAKSLVQPRLDFVAGAQINAFGDTLIGNQSDPLQSGSSAFSSLASANQSGWNIGFEASVPIGFRLAHTQVRNNELRLAHARAALAAQELDIAHEVRQAFQQLDRGYAVAQSAFNRRVAAEERVQAYQAQYELRGTTVDPLLRAQLSLAQADVAFHQSLAQYNQAITDFYYRTGTILDESNVVVSEDMWEPHAYSDALRRAWARSHAIDAPFLRTAPAEVVAPPGTPTRGFPFDAVTASAMSTPLTSAAPERPTSVPTPPRRSPSYESDPAAPLPSPPRGGSESPVPLPQAINPGMPGAPLVLPASATSPALTGMRTGMEGETPLIPSPGFQYPPVTPAIHTFESPARNRPMVLPKPITESEPPPPVFQAPESAWSVPQVTGRGGNSSSTNEDFHTSAAGDSFDMPLNQFGK